MIDGPDLRAGADEPGVLIARLIRAVWSQIHALEAGDFELFATRADHRDRLARALDQLDASAIGEAERSDLHVLLDLDRRVVELSRRLLDETGRELRQLRQGRGALRGYARPGTLDSARHTLIDERG